MSKSTEAQPILHEDDECAVVAKDWKKVQVQVQDEEEELQVRWSKEVLFQRQTNQHAG